MTRRTHVLVVGGGSDLPPRLRRTAGGVRTAVICRAFVLPWVERLEENSAVVVLPDDAPLETWLAYARAMHAIDPFDGLASFAEIDQDVAAAIAEELRVEYHSQDTIRRVWDKVEMRRCLRERGVEDVPGQLVSSPAGVLACGEAWGYPLVLKPSRGRASTGVSIVRSAAEVDPCFQRSSAASAPRLERSPLIAEPLLQGTEISVETLSEEGRVVVVALTEKHRDEETRVELGHVVPAALGDEVTELVEAHLERVFEALGIRFGATHTELMLTDQGPRMVETHVRPAGDQIWALVKDALGIDMGDFLLEQVAGLPILDRLRAQHASARRRPRGAAIWFVTADSSGELLEIRGVEEARAAPGVQDLHLLLEPGARLGRLTSSYSRVASIRTVGEDGPQALCLAQEAGRKLELLVRVVDQPSRA